MSFTFTTLDHVQLAMPRGGEAEAERFYCGVLGFSRIEKPKALQVRGGCWFQAGGIQLHLGVEDDFRPARKAHPARRVRGLDALLERLRAAGVAFRESDEVPGVRRGHLDDPFGNRIEIVEE